MKTKLLFSLILSLNFCLLSSQVPQGFNYMAIARDHHGDVLPNQALTVRIAILSIIAADFDTTVVWEEEHSVITNDNGLFQLRVGDPAATHIGGKADFFSDISWEDWQVRPYFLRTKINSYVMGTAQLFSVPYANVAGKAYSVLDTPYSMNGDTVLFANNVGVGTDNLHKVKFAVMGDNTTSEDALFEVRRKDGKSMFAVYNQGVRINVPMDDLVKGATKGGFAIGGFDGMKGTTHDLFYLNKDSIRMYVDKTPDLTKGATKGGFAIGGFDYAGKTGTPVQEYLSVTPDSTRIYVKEPTGGKGATKGGFAIGGFDGAKGTTAKYLDITKNNYFIGHETGSHIPATLGGLYNSVIGYKAARNLSTGSYNTILGYMADSSLISGGNNIVIGAAAGFNLTTGNHNTFIGSSAGYSFTNQEYNVMIGTCAGVHVNATGGYHGWDGSFNTFVGINSGQQIRTSKENVFLGTNAGYWLDNGLGNTFVGIDAGRSRDESGEPWDYRSSVNASYNTLIGDKSGYYITNGDNNLAIGYMAGFNNADGSGNVFIGNQAGKYETGSNKLFIDNQARASEVDARIKALVYGEFAANPVDQTVTLNAVLKLTPMATAPTSPTAGMIYFNSTDQSLRYYTGTQWMKIYGMITK